MMTMTEQERAQEGRARRWKLMAALSALVIGVAMAAVGAAYVRAGVSLWRSEWSPLAIITALTLGGAAAGLRFAWLDREAGLPERGDG